MKKLICVLIVAMSSMSWALEGDVNQDWVVNVVDLLMVRNRLGSSPSGLQSGDVDGDGLVNIADLLIVRNHLGEEGPELTADLMYSMLNDLESTLISEGTAVGLNVHSGLLWEIKVTLGKRVRLWEIAGKTKPFPTFVCYYSRVFAKQLQGWMVTGDADIKEVFTRNALASFRSALITLDKEYGKQGE